MTFLFDPGCWHHLLLAGAPTRSTTRRPPADRDTAPAGVRWTVRWDWPDGTHEFVGLKDDQVAAAAFWAGLVAKWRRLPYRPRMSIVQISGHDFRLHATYRPACTAPDCPTAIDVVIA